MKAPLRHGASRRGVCLSSLALLTAIACGDARSASGTGTLAVLVAPEETITNGVTAGSGVEDMRDGWSAEFGKFIIAVGDIDVHLSTNASEEAEDGNVFVVDLTKTPSNGLELWTLRDLPVGRWDFNFATPVARDGAERHETVTETDFNDMVSNNLTYLVEGVLTKSDGRTCPPPGLADPSDTAVAAGTNDSGDDCYENPEVGFVLAAAAPAHFGPCEIDEVPGFAITDGTERTVAVTIHGDHVFFNGFPEGAEGGVLRLAQWLADCDLDIDGAITRDELERIALSNLSEIDERYQLGGAPIQGGDGLENVWDYVVAQLRTQGHFQGEGDCAINGTAHAH